MHLWRKLQAQDSLKWVLGGQQQCTALPGPEIYECIALKGNAKTGHDISEAQRIDSGIVVSVNPVRAGNVEIAEIGPASEAPIGLNPVLFVKRADLSIRTQRLGGTVFLKEMNRQQEASANAGDESALSQRFSDARDHGSQNSGHRSGLPAFGYGWFQDDLRQLMR